MEETWRSYNREEHRISNTVPTSRYNLRLELELREIVWNCLELRRIVRNCVELAGIAWNCVELSGIAQNCPELRGIGRNLNALETLQVQDL